MNMEQLAGRNVVANWDELPCLVPPCSGHNSDMERSLEEVGRRVTKRREELHIDAAPFARGANVDPKTLASLEKGERWPHTSTRSKIEAALGWEVGSLAAMLDGGDATPMHRDEANAISRLRHPSNLRELEAEAESDDEIAEVLALVVEGRFDENLPSRAKRILDDRRITKLPELIDSLSREGKIEVYRFASGIAAEELGVAETDLPFAARTPDRPKQDPE